jgi:hypothetical protein
MTGGSRITLRTPKSDAAHVLEMLWLVGYLRNRQVSMLCTSGGMVRGRIIALDTKEVEVARGAKGTVKVKLDEIADMEIMAIVSDIDVDPTVRSGPAGRWPA